MKKGRLVLLLQSQKAWCAQDEYDGLDAAATEFSEAQQRMLGKATKALQSTVHQADGVDSLRV